MPQHLKDDVREGIRHAALEVFAAEGYRAAKMSDIAERAGVATGNVYRYFENKEALFADVVPDSLVRELLALVRARVGSLSGVTDVGTLRADAPFFRVTEELLRFSAEHRLEVVVLLGRSQGSRHEGTAARLVDELVGLASAHVRSVRKAAAAPSAATRHVLERVYRNLIDSFVDVLSSFDDEATIREAVVAYSRYHLAGLKGLLGL